jgi:hypothetical protein
VCVPQLSPQVICCIIQHMVLHLRCTSCCLSLVPAGCMAQHGSLFE